MAGARRFLVARASEYREGVRSHRVSQELLTGLVERFCAGAVTVDDRVATLPAVGPACAHRIPAVGEAISPLPLARCLRAAVGALLDQIAPDPQRPSIVVIMTDDQRWDTLEYMPVVSQRLAPEAVEFRESFVPTPVCCPSRASFLTGRYAHNTGVRANFPPLGGAPLLDDSTTIAVALRAAGYRTGLFGKYMNSTFLLTGVPAGWDSWNAFVSDTGNYFDYDLSQHGTIVRRGNDDRDYSTDAMSAMLLDFLDEHAHEPFFAVYTPFAPHADAGFLDTSPAPRHVGAFEGFVIPRRANYLESDLSDKPPWILLPLVILRFFGLFHEANHYFEIADEFAVGQLEMLLAVDEAVRDVLDRLADLGLEDNTVVVFTSDNGFAWGEHRWVGKSVPYEESIRVPLLVRYPLSRPAGAVEDRIVLNIDLAPTFAALAGATLPDGVDGRSLAGLLAGTQVEWRDDFLGEQWLANILLPVGNYAMVRSREWKYVRYESGFEELYDLLGDPFELENRVTDPSLVEVLEALRTRVTELRPD
jgi:N-acetylglucosamine-6-sulfatase